MKLFEVPAHWLVEIGWGYLKAGESRSAFSVWNQMGVRSLEEAKARKEMQCLEENGRELTRGRGVQDSVVMKRKELPGDICKGCGAVNHCILLLLHQNPDNLAILPSELVKGLYY